jgi:hypothetical protein
VELLEEGERIELKQESDIWIGDIISIQQRVFFIISAGSIPENNERIDVFGALPLDQCVDLRRTLIKKRLTKCVKEVIDLSTLLK